MLAELRQNNDIYKQLKQKIHRYHRYSTLGIAEEMIDPGFTRYMVPGISWNSNSHE